MSDNPNMPVDEFPTGCLVGDRYEVIEKIGEGGMGVVYKVTDREDDDLKALKILKVSPDNQSAAERRFRREYRALGKLRHPAVVDVFDSGLHQGHLFYVMELVRGYTLLDWGFLRPADGRSDDQLLSELDFYVQTMVTVLDALSDVHSCGIVHRDLKPQNIMVDHEGAVRIMDFGVACELQAATSDTSSDMILGTVGYVSPEEVKGEQVDARADLYSVGAMLYEYATGEPAFVDDNPVLAFSRMLRDDPVPPQQLQPLITSELNEVILRLMERLPGDRYQTAEEAALALNLCTGDAAGSTIDRPTSSTSSFGMRMRLPLLQTSHFIGQEEALHILNRMLQKSFRGKRRMALVSGEAGIGKTRIVEELARQEGRGRLFYLHGSCFRREGIFYQPYVEIIETFMSRVSKSRAPNPVADLLYNADLFPLLHEMQHDGESSHQETTAEEKLRLFDAVTRLLKESAKHRPVLLHLDDMHFADELTLMLTAYIIRNMEEDRICIVICIRPDEIKSRPDSPADRFLFGMRREGLLDAELLLPRLAKDEVGELLSSIIRWEPNPDLVDKVHQLTGGVPYFVEEVVKAMDLQAGEIAGGEIPIPSTVAEIARRQLMSFRAAHREVLRFAAHIGQEFDFDILLQVGRYNEGDLLDLIDDLLKADIIEEIQTPRRDAYRFVHPLTREVLLRQVGERKRRRLHLTIARAMEDLFHDRLESELSQNIEEIARQYRLADDPEKAFEYGYIAAKKAISRHAYDAARQHLQGLKDLADRGKIKPSPAQRTEMMLDLASCLRQTGRLPEARELLAAEQPRLRDEGNDEGAAEVVRRLSAIAREEGRLDAALMLLEGSQELKLSPRTSVSLMTERARILDLAGNQNHALALLGEASALAEEEGLSCALAEATALLGSIFSSRGESIEAERYLEHALATARASPASARQPLEPMILSLLAENAHETMDSASEIRYYEFCLAEHKKRREVVGSVIPSARMGRAYLVLGEMERGRQLLKEALRACRRYSLTRSLPAVLEAVSLHYLYAGELRKARADLLQAYELAEQVGDIALFFRIALRLVDLFILLKAFNEAETYQIQAATLADGRENALWKLRSATSQANLAVARGDRETAGRAIETVYKTAGSFKTLIAPCHIIKARLLHARLHELSSERDLARQLYDKTYDALQEIIWPYMLAKCLLLRGRFARTDGRIEDARQDIRASREIWSWIGTRQFLTECEEEERLLG